MQKQMLLKIFLILMPVLAVGLATTVDSVTVFDTVTGTTEYCSYFDPVPVENLQMLPSLAATLSLVSGILAAVYVAKKSRRCLKAAGYVAFASAAAASIPMIIRGDVLVIPNVGLPIFMMVQYLVTLAAGKLPEEKAADRKAPRLKKR